MCRPDDFPPYSWPPEMFRTLDPLEEESFRQWARDHHAHGIAANPLWHPVVRDEWQSLNGRCDRCGEAFTATSERAEVVERGQWQDSPAEAVLEDHLLIHVDCMRGDDVMA